MPDSFFSPFTTLPVAEKTIILLVTAVPDVAEETSRERERHITWAMGHIPSDANYSKCTSILSPSVTSGYTALPACFLLLEGQPCTLEWTQNSGSGPQPAHRHNGCDPIMLTCMNWSPTYLRALPLLSVPQAGFSHLSELPSLCSVRPKVLLCPLHVAAKREATVTDSAPGFSARLRLPPSP